MFRYLYDLVMDPEINPLCALPRLVRFQYMIILAYMWSAIFSLWSGYVALFGPSVVAHTALVIGVFFTADIFRRARNSRQRFGHAPTHRDAMKNPHDGTALYDDLWGAP